MKLLVEGVGNPWLITDLTNPEDMPADEAPLVYHERWEEELAFDEIKTI